MNISDLARDLTGKNTSQLVEQLKEMGMKDISVVSYVDDSQATLIKKLFKNKITPEEFKKSLISGKKPGSTGKRRTVKKTVTEKLPVSDESADEISKTKADEKSTTKTDKTPEKKTKTPIRVSAKSKSEPVADIAKPEPTETPAISYSEDDLADAKNKKTPIKLGAVKKTKTKPLSPSDEIPKAAKADKKTSKKVSSTDIEKTDDSTSKTEAPAVKDDETVNHRLSVPLKESAPLKVPTVDVVEPVIASTIIKRVLKKNGEVETEESKAKRLSSKKIIDEEWEDKTKIKPIKKDKDRKKFDDKLVEEDEDDLSTPEPVIIRTILKKTAVKKDRNRKKEKHTFNTRKKDIVIGSSASISELASLTGIRSADLIKTLLQLGHEFTINQYVDAELAQLAASEHGVEIVVKTDDIEADLQVEEDDADQLITRPPIVTIMGHVDHGKTSLLDYIRKTNVTEGESGGITQHIGAYYVRADSGDICFLDTPGHEAFTAMRSRGANVTDVVVVVVAADDGPMPQTIEAINHAKAAEVPIIVAINKCDKPDANPEKTIQKLLEFGLVSEKFGGDTTMVNISAIKGEGVKELMDSINLQADVLELKANPNRLSEGVVIESKMDKGRGIVVTLLVQKGTLRKGDNLVVGNEYGKIKALINEKGKTVDSAGPSVPIEILGLNGLPNAGDKFQVGANDKTVKTVAESRKLIEKDLEAQKKQQVKLENFFEGIEEDTKRTLNMIIKGDVIGSVEAISDSIQRIGNDKVGIRILHASVGAISNSDVALAAASDAIVIGFNVRPDANAKKTAQEGNVEIKIYNIIYNIIDDIRNALEGMLQPVIREEFVGKAEVLEIFNITGYGLIVGCMITEGKVVKDSKVRILRDNIVVKETVMTSLRRFKDDVKEVQQGFECGVGVEHSKEVLVKDVLEFFDQTEESGKL